LLAAYFDGRSNVKNGVFTALVTLAGLLNQVGDLLWHLGLHIAVQQQSRVVLIVVSQGTQVCLVSLARR
jgi:hypothetical protein